ncbi:glycoside hydrolase family 31 protein [Cesiribacter andamanensis]|uniref:Alpha-xylosidase n=1 Tax=Cesiribacter andamanensis AMV16 TaxID=1279009 RepID=M7N3U0_9BACT|nr:glycoside hydrolase family 31 protein [Cesiribacter andamanensis]EMR01881.1 Alpha-xylosidase [Cesiribacter andamanensis AMV16]
MEHTQPPQSNEPIPQPAHGNYMENHGNYMENFDAGGSGKNFPGAMLSWKQQDNLFYFYCKDVTLQVTLVSNKIIRFRYAIHGLFEPDFSYAIDPAFAPEPATISVVEDASEVIIETADLFLYLHKGTLLTRITNRNGLPILEDEIGYHWQKHHEHSSNIVIATKKISGGEQFYGLGDKPSTLNLRGRRAQMWGSDTYAYGPETDPIYKNIPFFIGLHHKVAYGIFLDNSFRTWFDFGSERPNVFSYWAHGGEMNYYFIYGPQALEVSETYTNMTGTPELPPLWALGYQQSKWSYYPESVVRELAAEFRKRRIPCDVIHLDIDYMDGYRCFTWNKTHFPDPAGMIRDLEKQGFKTISIIDPGIKVDPDYAVYQEGVEKDMFCRTADGPVYRGSVWPGICNFPDYTNPRVRQWWSGLFKDLIGDGIRGVWNDMNEPAVFELGTFPGDIRHDYDGNPCSHRKAHNVYGMQMSRATFDGVKHYLGDKRPLVITRSTYSGGQRFAAGWTGDNVASWDHLTVANLQCQRLSMCGFSFIGSDVGGFVESPSPELYIRWVQLAIFHPFLRTHSSGDHGEQEPWSFGKEAEDIVREMLHLRYQLLPYLYTAFWQYVSRGTPMLRSLFMLDQRDADTYYRQDEFAVGDNLLTCPIKQAGAEGRWLYLPQGEWYNFWNDHRYDTLGEEIWIETGLSRFPLFVRSGAVVPLGPPMQYVGEKVIETLDLHVYFLDGSRDSIHYEDAGDGYAYQKGGSNVVTFTVTGSPQQLELQQQREGSYTPSYTRYRVVLHGLPFTPAAAYLDDTELPLEPLAGEQYALLIPAGFGQLHILENGRTNG